MKRYAPYIVLLLLVCASPALGAVPTQIMVEDATGKRVYILKDQAPKGTLVRVRDWFYFYPRRHPRIWRTTGFACKVGLWACQIKAALR